MLPEAIKGLKGFKASQCFSFLLEKIPMSPESAQAGAGAGSGIASQSARSDLQETIKQALQDYLKKAIDFQDYWFFRQILKTVSITELEKLHEEAMPDWVKEFDYSELTTHAAFFTSSEASATRIETCSPTLEPPSNAL
jgi:hypothetical protein